ncbi:hypothetical protein BGZ58_003048 [Dissophora ornata]|nr:hypothetical protein BGZ58_003048 [Dissophora ornata]
MPFLGSPLAFTLVYIWSRRNPSIPLNFLGLFVFTAPYLPWVLLGFTLLLNSHFPREDLMGIIVGHIYYFFEDVWPKEQASRGRRYLQTPSFLMRRRGGVDIAAEIPEEPLSDQAGVQASEEGMDGHGHGHGNEGRYAGGGGDEQATPTVTTTSASSSSSSTSTGASSALEDGTRLEARSRRVVSTQEQT